MCLHAMRHLAPISFRRSKGAPKQKRELFFFSSSLLDRTFGASSFSLRLTLFFFFFHALSLQFQTHSTDVPLMVRASRGEEVERAPCWCVFWFRNWQKALSICFFFPPTDISSPLERRRPPRPPLVILFFFFSFLELDNHLTTPPFHHTRKHARN